MTTKPETTLPENTTMNAAGVMTRDGPRILINFPCMECGRTTSLLTTIEATDSVIEALTNVRNGLVKALRTAGSA